VSVEAIWFQAVRPFAPDEGESPAPLLRRMLLEQFVLTAAKAFKKIFVVDGLHPATFQVIAAAVEHLACAGISSK
jgi:hypothetical protein